MHLHILTKQKDTQLIYTTTHRQQVLLVASYNYGRTLQHLSAENPTYLIFPGWLWWLIPDLTKLSRTMPDYCSENNFSYSLLYFKLPCRESIRLACIVVTEECYMYEWHHHPLPFQRKYCNKIEFGDVYSGDWRGKSIFASINLSNK
jgi:hypothetical protein